jgi:hypothetical protein
MITMAIFLPDEATNKSELGQNGVANGFKLNFFSNEIISRNQLKIKHKSAKYHPTNHLKSKYFAPHQSK